VVNDQEVATLLNEQLVSVYTKDCNRDYIENQATLPLRWGGIGVSSAHRLALSAFLASAAGVTELLSQILHSRIVSTPDPSVEVALIEWKSFGCIALPTRTEMKSSAVGMNLMQSSG